MDTRRLAVALACALPALLAAPSSASLLDPVLKPSPAPSPTVSVAPSPSPTPGAEPESVTAAAGGGLSLSVPGSVPLGSFPATSSSISGSLGTVTVTTSGGSLVGTTGWLAKVSTSGFRAGADPAQVIAPGAVSYAAGLATARSGVSASACAPGASADLSVERVAFSCSGLSLVTGTSVSWQPTITISLSGNPVGTYSGTITHSVA